MNLIHATTLLTSVVIDCVDVEWGVIRRLHDARKLKAQKLL